jgi:hypothetical protein
MGKLSNSKKNCSGKSHFYRKSDGRIGPERKLAWIWGCEAPVKISARSDGRIKSSVSFREVCAKRSKTGTRFGYTNAQNRDPSSDTIS